MLFLSNKGEYSPKPIQLLVNICQWSRYTNKKRKQNMLKLQEIWAGVGMTKTIKSKFGYENYALSIKAFRSTSTFNPNSV